MAGVSTMRLRSRVDLDQGAGISLSVFLTLAVFTMPLQISFACNENGFKCLNEKSFSTCDKQSTGLILQEEYYDCPMGTICDDAMYQPCIKVANYGKNRHQQCSDKELSCYGKNTLIKCFLNASSEKYEKSEIKFYCPNGTICNADGDLPCMLSSNMKRDVHLNNFETKLFIKKRSCGLFNIGCATTHETSFCAIKISQSEPQSCKEPGIIEHISSCKHFYTCGPNGTTENEEQSYVKILWKCKKGQLYSNMEQRCVPAEIVECNKNEMSYLQKEMVTGCSIYDIFMKKANEASLKMSHVRIPLCGKKYFGDKICGDMNLPNCIPWKKIFSLNPYPLFLCKEQGIFRDPFNCKITYTCVPTLVISKYYLVIRACPDKMVYSITKGTCVDDDLSDCPYSSEIFSTYVGKTTQINPIHDQNNNKYNIQVIDFSNNSNCNNLKFILGISNSKINSNLTVENKIVPKNISSSKNISEKNITYSCHCNDTKSTQLFNINDDIYQYILHYIDTTEFKNELKNINITESKKSEIIFYILNNFKENETANLITGHTIFNLNSQNFKSVMEIILGNKDLNTTIYENENVIDMDNNSSCNELSNNITSENKFSYTSDVPIQSISQVSITENIAIYSTLRETAVPKTDQNYKSSYGNLKTETIRGSTLNISSLTTNEYEANTNRSGTTIMNATRTKPSITETNTVSTPKNFTEKWENLSNSAFSDSTKDLYYHKNYTDATTVTPESGVRDTYPSKLITLKDFNTVSTSDDLAVTTDGNMLTGYTSITTTKINFKENVTNTDIQDTTSHVNATINIIVDYNVNKENKNITLTFKNDTYNTDEDHKKVSDLFTSSSKKEETTDLTAVTHEISTHDPSLLKTKKGVTKKEKPKSSTPTTQTTNTYFSSSIVTDMKDTPESKTNQSYKSSYGNLETETIRGSTLNISSSTTNKYEAYTNQSGTTIMNATRTKPSITETNTVSTPKNFTEKWENLSNSAFSDSTKDLYYHKNYTDATTVTPESGVRDTYPSKLITPKDFNTLSTSDDLAVTNNGNMLTGYTSISTTKKTFKENVTNTDIQDTTSHVNATINITVDYNVNKENKNITLTFKNDTYNTEEGHKIVSDPFTSSSKKEETTDLTAVTNEISTHDPSLFKTKKGDTKKEKPKISTPTTQTTNTYFSSSIVTDMKDTTESKTYQSYKSSYGNLKTETIRGSTLNKGSLPTNGYEANTNRSGTTIMNATRTKPSITETNTVSTPKNFTEKWENLSNSAFSDSTKDLYYHKNYTDATTVTPESGVRDTYPSKLITPKDFNTLSTSDDLAVTNNGNMLTGYTSISTTKKTFKENVTNTDIQDTTSHVNATINITVDSNVNKKDQNITLTFKYDLYNTDEGHKTISDPFTSSSKKEETTDLTAVTNEISTHDPSLFKTKKGDTKKEKPKSSTPTTQTTNTYFSSSIVTDMKDTTESKTNQSYKSSYGNLETETIRGSTLNISSSTTNEYEAYTNQTNTSIMNATRTKPSITETNTVSTPKNFTEKWEKLTNSAFTDSTKDLYYHKNYTDATTVTPESGVRDTYPSKLTTLKDFNTLSTSDDLAFTTDGNKLTGYTNITTTKKTFKENVTNTDIQDTTSHVNATINITVDYNVNKENKNITLTFKNDTYDTDEGHKTVSDPFTSSSKKEETTDLTAVTNEISTHDPSLFKTKKGDTKKEKPKSSTPTTQTTNTYFSSSIVTDMKDTTESKTNQSYKSSYGNLETETIRGSTLNISSSTTNEYEAYTNQTNTSIMNATRTKPSITETNTVSTPKNFTEKWEKLTNSAFPDSTKDLYYHKNYTDATTVTPESGVRDTYPAKLITPRDFNTLSTSDDLAFTTDGNKLTGYTNITTTKKTFKENVTNTDIQDTTSHVNATINITVDYNVNKENKNITLTFKNNTYDTDEGHKTVSDPFTSSSKKEETTDLTAVTNEISTHDPSLFKTKKGDTKKEKPKSSTPTTQTTNTYFSSSIVTDMKDTTESKTNQSYKSSYGNLETETIRGSTLNISSSTTSEYEAYTNQTNTSIMNATRPKPSITETNTVSTPKNFTEKWEKLTNSAFTDSTKDLYYHKNYTDATTVTPESGVRDTYPSKLTTLKDFNTLSTSDDLAFTTDGNKLTGYTNITTTKKTFKENVTNTDIQDTTSHVNATINITVDYNVNKENKNITLTFKNDTYNTDEGHKTVSDPFTSSSKKEETTDLTAVTNEISTHDPSLFKTKKGDTKKEKPKSSTPTTPTTNTYFSSSIVTDMKDTTESKTNQSYKSSYGNLETETIRGSTLNISSSTTSEYEAYTNQTNTSIMNATRPKPSITETNTVSTPKNFTEKWEKLTNSAFTDSTKDLYYHKNYTDATTVTPESGVRDTYPSKLTTLKDFNTLSTSDDLAFTTDGNKLTGYTNITTTKKTFKENVTNTDIQDTTSHVNATINITVDYNVNKENKNITLTFKNDTYNTDEGHKTVSDPFTSSSKKEETTDLTAVTNEISTHDPSLFKTKKGDTKKEKPKSSTPTTQTTNTYFSSSIVTDMKDTTESKTNQSYKSSYGNLETETIRGSTLNISSSTTSEYEAYTNQTNTSIMNATRPKPSITETNTVSTPKNFTEKWEKLTNSAFPDSTKDLYYHKNYTDATTVTPESGVRDTYPSKLITLKDFNTLSTSDDLAFTTDGNKLTGYTNRTTTKKIFKENVTNTDIQDTTSHVNATINITVDYNVNKENKNITLTFKNDTYDTDEGHKTVSDPFTSSSKKEETTDITAVTNEISTHDPSLFKTKKGDTKKEKPKSSTPTTQTTNTYFSSSIVTDMKDTTESKTNQSYKSSYGHLETETIRGSTLNISSSTTNEYEAYTNQTNTSIMNATRPKPSITETNTVSTPKNFTEKWEKLTNSAFTDSTKDLYYHKNYTDATTVTPESGVRDTYPSKLITLKDFNTLSTSDDLAFTTDGNKLTGYTNRTTTKKTFKENVTNTDIQDTTSHVNATINITVDYNVNKENKNITLTFKNDTYDTDEGHKTVSDPFTSSSKKEETTDITAVTNEISTHDPSLFKTKKGDTKKEKPKSSTPTTQTTNTYFSSSIVTDMKDTTESKTNQSYKSSYGHLETETIRGSTLNISSSTTNEYEAYTNQTNTSIMNATRPKPSITEMNTVSTPKNFTEKWEKLTNSAFTDSTKDLYYHKNYTDATTVTPESGVRDTYPSKLITLIDFNTLSTSDDLAFTTDGNKLTGYTNRTTTKKTFKENVTNTDIQDTTSHVNATINITVDYNVNKESKNITLTFKNDTYDTDEGHKTVGDPFTSSSKKEETTDLTAVTNEISTHDPSLFKTKKGDTKKEKPKSSTPTTQTTNTYFSSSIVTDMKDTTESKTNQSYKSSYGNLETETIRGSTLNISSSTTNEYEAYTNQTNTSIMNATRPKPSITETNTVSTPKNFTEKWEKLTNSAFPDSTKDLYYHKNYTDATTVTHESGVRDTYPSKLTTLKDFNTLSTSDDLAFTTDGNKLTGYTNRTTTKKIFKENVTNTDIQDTNSHVNATINITVDYNVNKENKNITLTFKNDTYDTDEGHKTVSDPFTSSSKKEETTDITAVTNEISTHDPSLFKTKKGDTKKEKPKSSTPTTQTTNTYFSSSIVTDMKDTTESKTNQSYKSSYGHLETETIRGSTLNISSSTTNEYEAYTNQTNTSIMNATRTKPSITETNTVSTPKNFTEKWEKLTNSAFTDSTKDLYYHKNYTDATTVTPESGVRDTYPSKLTTLKDFNTLSTSDDLAFTTDGNKLTGYTNITTTKKTFKENVTNTDIQDTTSHVNATINITVDYNVNKESKNITITFKNDTYNLDEGHKTVSDPFTSSSKKEETTDLTAVTNEISTHDPSLFKTKKGDTKKEKPKSSTPTTQTTNTYFSSSIVTDMKDTTESKTNQSYKSSYGNLETETIRGSTLNISSSTTNEYEAYTNQTNTSIMNATRTKPSITETNTVSTPKNFTEKWEKLTNSAFTDSTKDLYYHKNYTDATTVTPESGVRDTYPSKLITLKDFNTVSTSDDLAVTTDGNMLTGYTSITTTKINFKENVTNTDIQDTTSHVNATINITVDYNVNKESKNITITFKNDTYNTDEGHKTVSDPFTSSSKKEETTDLTAVTNEISTHDPSLFKTKKGDTKKEKPKSSTPTTQTTNTYFSSSIVTDMKDTTESKTNQSYKSSYGNLETETIRGSTLNISSSTTNEYEAYTNQTNTSIMNATRTKPSITETNTVSTPKNFTEKWEKLTNSAFTDSTKDLYYHKNYTDATTVTPESGVRDTYPSKLITLKDFNTVSTSDDLAVTTDGNMLTGYTSITTTKINFKENVTNTDIQDTTSHVNATINITVDYNVNKENKNITLTFKNYTYNTDEGHKTVSDPFTSSSKKEETTDLTAVTNEISTHDPSLFKTKKGDTKKEKPKSSTPTTQTTNTYFSSSIVTDMKDTTESKTNQSYKSSYGNLETETIRSSTLNISSSTTNEYEAYTNQTNTSFMNATRTKPSITETNTVSTPKNFTEKWEKLTNSAFTDSTKDLYYHKNYTDATTITPESGVRDTYPSKLITPRDFNTLSTSDDLAVTTDGNMLTSYTSITTTKIKFKENVTNTDIQDTTLHVNATINITVDYNVNKENKNITLTLKNDTYDTDERHKSVSNPFTSSSEKEDTTNLTAVTSHISATITNLPLIDDLTTIENLTTMSQFLLTTPAPRKTIFDISSFLITKKYNNFEPSFLVNGLLAHNSKKSLGYYVFETPHDILKCENDLMIDCIAEMNTKGKTIGNGINGLTYVVDFYIGRSKKPISFSMLSYDGKLPCNITKLDCINSISESLPLVFGDNTIDELEMTVDESLEVSGNFTSGNFHVITDNTVSKCSSSLITGCVHKFLLDTEQRHVTSKNLKLFKVKFDLANSLDSYYIWLDARSCKKIKIKDCLTNWKKASKKIALKYIPSKIVLFDQQIDIDKIEDDFFLQSFVSDFDPFLLVTGVSGLDESYGKNVRNFFILDANKNLTCISTNIFECIDSLPFNDLIQISQKLVKYETFTINTYKDKKYPLVSFNILSLNGELPCNFSSLKCIYNIKNNTSFVFNKNIIPSLFLPIVPTSNPLNNNFTFNIKNSTDCNSSKIIPCIYSFINITDEVDIVVNTVSAFHIKSQDEKINLYIWFDKNVDCNLKTILDCILQWIIHDDEIIVNNNMMEVLLLNKNESFDPFRNLLSVGMSTNINVDNGFQDSENKSSLFGLFNFPLSIRVPTIENVPKTVVSDTLRYRAFNNNSHTDVENLFTLMYSDKQKFCEKSMVNSCIQYLKRSSGILNQTKTIAQHINLFENEFSKLPFASYYVISEDNMTPLCLTKNQQCLFSKTSKYFLKGIEETFTIKISNIYESKDRIEIELDNNVKVVCDSNNIVSCLLNISIVSNEANIKVIPTSIYYLESNDPFNDNSKSYKILFESNNFLCNEENKLSCVAKYLNNSKHIVISNITLHNYIFENYVGLTNRSNDVNSEGILNKSLIHSKVTIPQNLNNNTGFTLDLDDKSEEFEDNSDYEESSFSFTTVHPTDVINSVSDYNDNLDCSTEEILEAMERANSKVNAAKFDNEFKLPPVLTPDGFIVMQGNVGCVKGGSFGDRNDCEAFHICAAPGKKGKILKQNNHLSYLLFRCSAGTYFSAVKRICIETDIECPSKYFDNVPNYLYKFDNIKTHGYPKLADASECNSPGIYAINNSCNRYYMCFHADDDTLVVFYERCPIGLKYHRKKQVCVSATVEECSEAFYKTDDVVSLNSVIDA